jgi:two-component system, NtrC family, C4-dicarboxylate transport sensor histidine kinase DctB
MMEGRFNLKGAQRFFVLSLAALLVLLALLYGADRFSEARALNVERDRLAGLVRLTATSYERQLDKFRLVAITLADDSDVRRLIEQPGGAAGTTLNDRLSKLTTALDASVIYLLDADGQAIAASNSRQPDSFLGQSYAFRAYFARALGGGAWEQYALGTRSKIPGYYIARRVVGAGGQRGVLVVKVRFDRLEADWAASLGTAFVADNRGIISVTSRPEWRFQTVAALAPDVRQQASQSGDFGNSLIRQVAEFANNAVVRPGESYRRGVAYVAAIDPIQNGGRVYVLEATEDSVAAERTANRLKVLLAFGLIGALIAYSVVRRRAIVAAEQRDAALRMDALKERLVQANKLSTLGQIAAGVGHEVNQPLTAIALRIQNALKQIALGRLPDAKKSLEEMSGLVERAGAITGELRTFSRRSARKPGAVKLSAAFSGVRLLLNDRIERTQTTLRLDGPDASVFGEPIRLEQVLVNLLQNAIDAMGEGGRIDIATTVDADWVTVSVTDNGPGIAPEQREKLFQPFATSKATGVGLGLVISHDIIAEFGGTLSHVPTDKGTTFQIRLKGA